TAVTLIGSYVAFSTSTGSCINAMRRAVIGDANLLPAGLSDPGAIAPSASGVWRPRESTMLGRRALIALPSGTISTQRRRSVAFLKIARATVNPITDLAPASRKVLAHESSVAP